MFSFALLYVLASSECPANGCVCFSDIFTGLTAPGLATLFAFGGWCAVAVTAVIGVEVGSGVVVEVERGGGDGPGFGERGETG